MRYVLVHGALHGAWCWDRVVPELRALGHDAVAVELPGHGQRVSEKASLDGYCSAVTGVLEDGDVLVGHSMGGYVISLVANAQPTTISHLIFLAGGVPIDGSSILSSFAPPDDPELAHMFAITDTEANGKCMVISEQRAADELLFHDCTPADQAWAFEHLTPQQLEVLQTPIHVAPNWADDIPRSYILCTDDRGSAPVAYVNAALGRLKLARAWAIKSSHSPFISQPFETARHLDLCPRIDG